MVGKCRGENKLTHRMQKNNDQHKIETKIKKRLRQGNIEKTTNTTDLIT